MSVKRIARIALFAAILFVQEFALSFIPNVQFTQVLIAVYYYSFGLVDTIIITTIHVILDNLSMGSFSFIYTPAMYIGWLLLPIILHLFKKIKNRLVISSLVGLHGLLYSLIFIVIDIILMEISFWPYFVSSLPFTIILIINGFITTLLLKDKLVDLLNMQKNLLIKKNYK